MKRITHFIKLLYLKPKWFLSKLWVLAKNYPTLVELIDIDRKLEDQKLEAIRENRSADVLRIEGRMEVIKSLLKK